LLEHHAAVDARDARYHRTPLGWTLYGWGERHDRNREGYYQAVALLVGAGATVDPNWLNDEDRGILLGKLIRNDGRMLAALGAQMK
jgi:hypothetical protein